MYNTVKDIREAFKLKLSHEEFVIDKTGVKTIEIVGSSFIADEPTIFGEVNEGYVKRELEWYESRSLKVADIPGKTPKIWEDVSSKQHGEINSNYGYLIWSPENHNQYLEVLGELSRNKDSRRAIMIYTRPTMHLDYCRDGMSDFICTNTVQYLIRDNKLNCVVNMRSNDCIFGFANDYAWQKHVLDKLADDLDIATGEILWQTGSLHVYERHFNLVK